MPEQYNPNTYVVLQPVYQRDSFLESPPIVWPVLSQQVSIETGSSAVGRTSNTTGNIKSDVAPKIQDTYLFSGSKLTGAVGRAFDDNLGTVRDDNVSPTYHSYRLIQESSAPGVAWDVVSHDTTAGIEPCMIVLGRGVPPVSVQPTEGNYNMFVEFASGSVGDNIRLAFAYGKAISLQYLRAGSNTWVTRLVFNNTKSSEQFFADSGGAVTLLVSRNDQRGYIEIEINREHKIKFAVDGASRVLPAAGKIRWFGIGGIATFEYYPARHANVVINKKSRDFGRPITNVSSGFVLVNGIAQSDPAATNTAALTSDAGGIGVSVTSSMPDAGDGKGSLHPAIVSDFTVVIPGVWSDSPSGIAGQDPYGYQRLFPINVQELQVLDDNSRCISASATISITNDRGTYTGGYGHRAVDIFATDGNAPYMKRFTGIAGVGEEGLRYFSVGTLARVGVPCQDNSIKMMVPLEDECIFDGWCIFSAVRFLTEKGNIHPRFLANIPLYIPPGATSDAPYGPAGTDCPYFILGRGLGNQPKYKFDQNSSPWAILQLLATEVSEQDPYTGKVQPYYMGFTNDGMFNFHSIDPNNQPSKGTYGDTEYNNNIGKIQQITVSHSINQMRTALDFQGIDPITNELLYYHLPLSNQTKASIGWNYPWLERDARYGSLDYITTVAKPAAQQASLPVEMVTMKVPFHPFINAGDVVGISEARSLGRSGQFQIMSIRSTYGIGDISGKSGLQVNESIITARAVQNF